MHTVYVLVFVLCGVTILKNHFIICYFMKDSFPKVGSNVQSVSNMASIASQREAGTWMQAFGWDVDKWWSYG